MRSVSSSIKFFGVYLIFAGLGLVLMPALVLSLVGIPIPTDVWIRVVGVLTSLLGLYFWVCGSANIELFAHVSVAARGIFTLACILFVITGLGPWQLLLFAGVDVAGAVWTVWALRAERR